MTRSMRYQPIFNGLKFTLHRARVLDNVVVTTVIEMVEMVEILDGRVGKHSVERVRYVINNLLHLVIVKYLVIFHADPCNKSYIYSDSRLNRPESVSLASLTRQLIIILFIK